ncbi:MAG: hypothetical protein CSA66_04880 [Proteobacteria bacterium]|nr:MAG: hypothetical protein CSA66_04880 [Pseudomonadota bacterium]
MNPGAPLAALALLASAGLIAPSAAHAAAAAPGDYYRFLSRQTVGAADFTKRHPAWDGRGVVIAVLDTGVDASVPGLTKTSTGEIKVIEARDFTGQGDVDLTEVTPTVDEGVTVLRADGGVVRGHQALSPAPPADAALYLGFFDESTMANSAVTDVNGNGRGDDRFAVLAWRGADGEGLFAVDTDGDGDLADEPPRGSYADTLEHFAFVHPDPRKNQTPIAFSPTVDLDARPPKVELHFDDGSHGTHCAGIAAGHDIEGRVGFDGIAPGAKVMSLKIGHGALAGGATVPGSMKAAIEYASDWARAHRVPVVMNISYGIASEHEGASDIDQVLDAALTDNRWLVASVSAGNSGPGLSTVGTPGAARLAWTAGALLDRPNAEALYGSKVSRDRVFAFSSRGGELAKPDGVTPGVAWSTIPPYHARPIKAGTSMAAPQASGVHALLASAALAEGVPWTSGKLKRALRTTAKPVAGFTSVDQGAGLVNVGRAWRALKKQRRHATGEHVVDWRVETAIPTAPGELGTASYWRAGRYLPQRPRRISVRWSPIFFGDVSDADRTRAFDDFDLDTDAGWLDVDRGSVGLRGGGRAEVQLSLTPAKLRAKPGLHVAHLIARVGGVEAFRVPVVALVPHRFDSGHRRRAFKGTLEAGDVARYFIEVPPGATSMRAALKTPEARFGDTWLLAYDPSGRRVEAWQHRASSEAGTEAELLLCGDDLTPGVWELDTYTPFRATETSRYTLDVSFFALERPETVTYTIADGGTAKASVTVTNRFDEAFVGRAQARHIGRSRSRTLHLSGTRHEEPIVVGAETGQVELSLAMDRDTYDLFTDVAVNVLDASGAAVAQGGFSGRYERLSFSGPPGRYRLEIVGATAHDPDEDAPLSWQVELREVLHAAAPVPMSASGPDGSALTLLPQVPTTLTLKAQGPLAELPDGFHHRVDLNLTTNKGARWLDLPLVLTRE